MDLLTTAEVADYLRTSEATLRYWRHKGTGPKSFRMGAKRVMYRRTDVDAYVMEQINAERNEKDKLVTLDGANS